MEVKRPGVEDKHGRRVSEAGRESGPRREAEWERDERLKSPRVLSCASYTFVMLNSLGVSLVS